MNNGGNKETIESVDVSDEGRKEEENGRRKRRKEGGTLERMKEI